MTIPVSSAHSSVSIYQTPKEGLSQAALKSEEYKFEPTLPPSFNQVMGTFRQLVGKIGPDERIAILCEIINDPYYKEFLSEPLMKEGLIGQFSMEISYQIIIDAVARKYHRFCSQGGPRLRGGYLRQILRSWFESVSKKTCFGFSEVLPPDIDIILPASDLSWAQIKEVEYEIFRHLGMLLCKKKHYLANCYAALASICFGKRRDITKGSLYTLTTLHFAGSPNLEIIIYKEIANKSLLRLDNLSLCLKKRTLHCNSIPTSENALLEIARDNADYYLVVENPAVVDGPGLARIVSHITLGGTLSDQNSFDLIYNNLRQSLEKQGKFLVPAMINVMQKCLMNHHANCPLAVFVMYWNLYALSGFSESQFYYKACENNTLFGFQKDHALPSIQKWAYLKWMFPEENIEVDWVKFGDKEWMRVKERNLYWLVPFFTLDDAELVELMQGRQEVVSKKFVSKAFKNADVFTHYSLPLALIQQPEERWYPQARNLFDSLSAEDKEMTATAMVTLGHPHSLPFLLKIYSEFPPHARRFFGLIEKLMRLPDDHMTVCRADHLCELAKKLKAKKWDQENLPVLELCRWLLEKCSSNQLAYDTYKHLLDQKIIPQNHTLITEKTLFRSLSGIEILESPIFTLFSAAERVQVLRAYMYKEDHCEVEHLLFKAYTDGIISRGEAKALFDEFINHFTFTIIHWIVDLYESKTPMPLPTFKKLPLEVASALTERLPVTFDHVRCMMERHPGSLEELLAALKRHESLLQANLPQFFEALANNSLCPIEARTDTLCEWAKKLKAGKWSKGNSQVTRLCEWLLMRCESNRLAFDTYNHLVALGIIQPNPKLITERASYRSLSGAALLESPITSLFTSEQRFQAVRSCMLEEDFCTLDQLLYQAYADNIIDRAGALVLIDEFLEHFAFSNIDWITDIYGTENPIPMQVFERLPATVAHALAMRVAVTFDHLNYVMGMHTGSLLELLPLLTKHQSILKDNIAQCVDIIGKMIICLRDASRHAEADVWMQIIHSEIIHLNALTRSLFLNWSLYLSQHEQAADLALTLPDTAPAKIKTLVSVDSLSTEKRCALLLFFKMSDTQIWGTLFENARTKAHVMSPFLDGYQSGLFRGEKAKALLKEMFTCLCMDIKKFLDSLPEGSTRVIPSQGILRAVEACIGYGAAFKTTSDERAILLGGVMAYLPSVPANHSLIDNAIPIFKKDNEHFKNFLLLLAQPYLPVYHDRALALVLENKDQPYFFDLAKKIIAMATIWLNHTDHREALTELAHELLRHCNTQNATIPLLKLLLKIKILGVSTLTATILTQLKEVHEDAWISFFEEWIGGHPFLSGDQDLDESDSMLIKAVSEKFLALYPHDDEARIRLAKALGHLAQEMIRTGNTNKAFIVACYVIDFFTKSGKILQSNTAAYLGLRAIGIQLMLFLLDFPGRTQFFIDRIIPFYEQFLTVKIVAGKKSFESILPANETTENFIRCYNKGRSVQERIKVRATTSSGSLLVTTEDCILRRANEIHCKATLIRDIISTLFFNPNYFVELINVIENLILQMSYEFPEQDQLCLRVLHSFVFSTTSVQCPQHATYRKIQALILLKKLMGIFDLNKAPFDYTQLVLYYDGVVLEILKPHERNNAAKDIISAALNLKHPYWLAEALVMARGLCGMIRDEEYLIYLHKIYMEASTALEEVFHPFSEDNVLVAACVTDSFLKCRLATHSGDTKKGISMRTQALRSLIQAGKKHLSILSEYPVAGNICAVLASFQHTCLKKGYLSSSLAYYFDNLDALFEMISKNGYLESQDIVKGLLTLNIDFAAGKTGLPLDLREKRLYILDKGMSILKRLDGSQDSLKMLYDLAVEKKWFDGIANGEELKKFLFTNHLSNQSSDVSAQSGSGCDETQGAATP